MSHHLRGLRGEEDVRHERLYWRTTTKSMAGSRRIFPIVPDLSAPCVVLDHLVRSTSGQGGLPSTRCRSMEDDWPDATVGAGLLFRRRRGDRANGVAQWPRTLPSTGRSCIIMRTVVVGAAASPSLHESKKFLNSHQRKICMSFSTTCNPSSFSVDIHLPGGHSDYSRL